VLFAPFPSPPGISCFEGAVGRRCKPKCKPGGGGGGGGGTTSCGCKITQTTLYIEMFHSDRPPSCPCVNTGKIPIYFTSDNSNPCYVPGGAWANGGVFSFGCRDNESGAGALINVTNICLQCAGVGSGAMAYVLTGDLFTASGNVGPGTCGTQSSPISFSAFADSSSTCSPLLLAFYPFLSPDCCRGGPGTPSMFKALVTPF
jgi:hypothetical protein